MIRVLIFGFFLSLSLVLNGQNAAETLKKSEELIGQKKYNSAFNLLDAFDPGNQNPEIALAKEDLVLEYFVTSIGHQIFALKDLKMEENVMDYRGKEGPFDMHIFPVDSILQVLIQAHPEHCTLYRGLGLFYYEAHLKYGANWLEEESVMYEKMQNNFQKAVDGNCGDYMTYYVLGYLQLLQEKPDKAIPLFIQSIALDKNYASAHYNLAYAYLMANDYDKAIPEAAIALDQYTDVSYKSDAARIIGNMYEEKKDDAKAQLYYEQANQIKPGDYYNLRYLLGLYLRTGNGKLEEIREAFFKSDPESPTIYSDLGELYYGAGKVDELSEFYKKQLKAYKKQDLVAGNLNFYLGANYMETDKKQAKKYFTEAKGYFEKVLEKDNEVFGLLEKVLAELDK